MYVSKFQELQEYMERRREQLRFSHTTRMELLGKIIPQRTRDGKKRERKLKLLYTRLAREFKRAHEYEDKHIAFVAFRVYAYRSKMEEHYRAQVKYVEEKTAAKQYTFDNLDVLVEEKTKVQLQLMDKCRELAWARIRMWGRADR